MPHRDQYDMRGRVYLAFRLRSGVLSITMLFLLAMSASACVIELKKNPPAHPPDGVVHIRATEDVCWSLYSLGDERPLRVQGCGNRDVAVRNSRGEFTISLSKTDETDGLLSATVESGGRIIRRGSTNEKNKRIHLSG